MKKRTLLVISAVLLFFSAACTNKDNSAQTKQDKDKGLTVYTTVYPLTYFTERIGGEHVTVSSIYPAGANEHTFEPTQRDMMKLADADIFFYIGLGLEGFVDKASQTLKGEQVEMIATANSISDEELELGAIHQEEEHHEAEEGHDDHHHGDIDPHVWISPHFSQKLSLSIKDALVAHDPENEAIYTENYEKLVQELEQLHVDFQKMANEAEHKTFFVSHAAFGYLAEPYGLEQVAIAGLNSQDEPSQKRLTEIVELAKKNDISYILFEQNVSSKITKVIQDEVDAESLVLHNLGVLTEKDIENDETYFTLMRKNLNTLRTALNEK
ncbi:metal ABC transporter solute-binding protein, Zn/Mn family [Chungangia koreensis]|uniref:Metal ABC transporter solute-binding protein, Zn/Mn family n=1 Tax=Chungangia koreensis TaxID=752657 RepID=A0ABV8X5F8_9LACT